MNASRVCVSKTSAASGASRSGSKVWREARGFRNFGREFLESPFPGNPSIHKSLKRLLPPPPPGHADLLPTGRLCARPERPRRTSRLPAPRPACASQVKASHLGSPPSAVAGPGPVRRLCLYLPSSPHTGRRMRNLLAGGRDEGTAQGRQRGKTSNTPDNDGSADEHEEAAAGNRGDGWFFDLLLPPQVVGHPFIRGWFLRNLPVHVPSGRLLKEHHVALLSLTTRGPY